MAVQAACRTNARNTVAAILALAIVSCASPHPPDPQSQIAVTDLAAVAGRWDGTVWKHPDMKYAESVLLMVKPDGAFNFVGQRVAEFHLGTGSFKLEAGRLVSDGFGRHIDFALYDRKGKALLAGAVRGKKGELFYVELAPTNSAR